MAEVAAVVDTLQDKFTGETPAAIGIGTGGQIDTQGEIVGSTGLIGAAVFAQQQQQFIASL